MSGGKWGSESLTMLPSTSDTANNVRSMLRTGLVQQGYGGKPGATMSGFRITSTVLTPCQTALGKPGGRGLTPA